MTQKPHLTVYNKRRQAVALGNKRETTPERPWFSRAFGGFCLKSGGALVQGEPGAFGVQEACFFQLADFRGHGGAFYPQVVCQGLAVQGDGELGSTLGFGLGQKVGKELFPGGFLGHNADFVGKRQIFPGDELQ